MCTEQKVTVGEPEREGRLRRPRTMSKTIPQVPLLVESALNVRTIGSRLKGVLVEQDSEIRIVGVRPELIGDVRKMITGFLKNNRKKLSTHSGHNVGRISARRIPLKKGKAELMMHEIAVNCGNLAKSVGLGLPKTDHGKNQCPWFQGRGLFLYED